MISCVLLEESKPLPDVSDFMVDWLETRPGRTDRLTGVPPSLYTLTATDLLQCGQSQGPFQNHVFLFFLLLGIISKVGCVYICLPKTVHVFNFK